MRSFLLLCVGAWSAACGALPRASGGASGTLLLIGGGLDNDNRPVYTRFLELAAVAGPPRIVIATAATGPQDEEATDKAEALRTWAPGVPVEIVRRETSTADTVAAIDRATAMFFTGGDQKRITARYRPDEAASPEWQAMQRLLARGGVIAGASAGCAMMGRTMLEGGRSAAALGIAPASPPTDGEPVPLGPRLGPGMAFLPWGLTESHFFERDRVGRIVPALAASGERWGLCVGEDAAVEVDLATGDLVGVSVAESLLVDAAHARRDGAVWLGLRADVIEPGERVSLLAARPALAPKVPGAATRDVPVAEPGQNRQLASWRLFRQASEPAAGVLRLRCDGWSVRACADGPGQVAFCVQVDGGAAAQ